MDLSKLPFVVQPKAKPVMQKVGSEEAGVIEVPVRGYLTTGEKSFVQQTMSTDDSTLEIVKLSRQVSAKYNMGLDEAYQFVIRVISGQENSETGREISIEFSHDISKILTAMVLMQDKEQIVAAMVLLRYRTGIDIDFEDVIKLHPDLISGLYAVYQSEAQKDASLLELAYKDEEQKDLTVNEIEKKPSTRRKSKEETS